MREMDKIIIHCSATKEGQEISAATIDEWHKARGWRSIGYHYVIGLDGMIEYGRPITETGAHVKNHNKGSIGICYIGGLDSVSKTAKDTRTPEQIATLLELLRVLKKLHPNATIHGHNEFSAKACPCFDAYNEYCNI